MRLRARLIPVAAAAMFAFAVSSCGGDDRMSWAEILEQSPDPAVIKDQTVRDRIVKTGLPWRVKDRSSGLELLLIPPGTYQRGVADAGDANADAGAAESRERPAHRVTLTRPFYLGRYPVTNGEYHRFYPRHHSGSFAFGTCNEDPQPVVSVGWIHAISFAETHGLRLPTEAEWTYACRAGTEGARYGPLDDVAWYAKNTKTSHAVGKLAANGFGLQDMLGNVWEWCADRYGETEYQRCAGGVTDPTGPESGTLRVLRGGSWLSPAKACRASARSFRDSGEWDYNIGFRVARSL